MINRASLVWMVLAIAAGVGLFLLKYQVKGMEEKLAAIHEHTLRNLDAVHVLKAEWGYLNRPARLEDLGRRLLSLQPTDSRRTVAITDIPLRPEHAPSQPEGRDEPAPDARGHAVSPAAGHLPPSLATYRREQ